MTLEPGPGAHQILAVLEIEATNLPIGAVMLARSGLE